MNSPSMNTFVLRKRDTSADELFKNLLKTTRLRAEIPAKNEKNVKPGAANLTELCTSKESIVRGEQVAETSIKPTNPHQSTQTQSSSHSDNEVLSLQVLKGPNKLEQIYQALYVAQAQVQLEVKQIQRAQSLAAAQQKALEDASMNVRTITGALHAAQQDVATAAVRAHTAQLQLAAHDQLLFAARQKVDALSSQAVGLQAEESIVLPNLAVDIQALLGKLKAPLPENLKPTAIPAMCPEMDSNLAFYVAPTLNQSTPVNSKDQKARDLEGTIREILESRNKNSINKRSSVNYDNHEEDVKRSFQCDNYFYRWFINDIRKQRRRKRRLKGAKKNNKHIDDNYYD